MNKNPSNVRELEKSGPGLRVALYLRQSDKEQRLSIGQQRQECRAFAQSRGWEISREYVDDGKSGSKAVEQRHSWHQLIADAQQPDRAFDAILCWDTSRFGRLDAMAGAIYKNQLRKAGVWLETARGERIDWNTSMGRIMDALQSERDHEYSLNISANVIRGRRAVFDLGYFAKRLPYGFDRQYVEHGVVKHTVPRGEVFAKPRNWRLVPVPNPIEAKVIKWAFDQWRERDMSFMATIRELRERGSQSPSGQPTWTLAQVKRLLTERTYTGDLWIGEGSLRREVHARIGERVRENAIPAIVDRLTFDVVQQKVREREGAEWRPKSSSGPLSGILRCGKCGHTLARRRMPDGTKYVCESASKRPHLGCRQWRVDEAELLPVVCKIVVDAVDFEVLRNVQARPEQRDPTILDGLRRQAAELNQKIAKGSENLLLADAALFAPLQSKLLEMRTELDRVTNTLRLATSDANSDERGAWLKWWDGNKAKLVMVAAHESDEQTGADTPGSLVTCGAGKAIRLRAVHAEPATLRDLLRRLSVQVHLWWEQYGEAGRRWRLTTGVLRANFNAAAPAATGTAKGTAATGETEIAIDVNGKKAGHHTSGNRARRARRPAARPAPSR
jgi:site-specific DNA recombinase